METDVHRRLKTLAARLLWQIGFRAVAVEAACPIRRYRVDVAGYLDPLPKRLRPARRHRPVDPLAPAMGLVRIPGQAQTALIECKGSRSDFLRDCSQQQQLLEERQKLYQERLYLEEHRVKVEEPHLRCCDSALFPEMETWDFAASQLPSYQKVLRRLRRIEKQLYTETKFCLIHRYRLADRLYLAAPRGLIQPQELPQGWGLVEWSSQELRAAKAEAEEAAAWPLLGVAVAMQAPALACPELHRLRLLRNIAVAGTARTLGRELAADERG